MPISLNETIIFSAGGVVGFLGRQLIIQIMASTRDKNTRAIIGFNSAAIKLREAFLPERMALYPAQFALKIPLHTFLAEAYEKHRTAVFNFADFLSNKRKKSFMNAWYTYYCHEDQRNEKGLPFFEQYSCRGLIIEKEHEMKNLVKLRIESILAFAEIK